HAADGAVDIGAARLAAVDRVAGSAEHTGDAAAERDRLFARGVDLRLAAVAGEVDRVAGGAEDRHARRAAGHSRDRVASAAEDRVAAGRTDRDRLLPGGADDESRARPGCDRVA